MNYIIILKFFFTKFIIL